MNNVIGYFLLGRWKRVQLVKILVLMCLCVDASAQAIYAGRGGTAYQNNPGAPMVNNASNQTVRPRSVIITGHVESVNKDSARRVKIMASRDDKDGEISSVQTGPEGRYQIKLGNGDWTVRACDSSYGYTPLGWKISVVKGEIGNFRELSLPMPTITQVNIDISSDKGVISAGDLVEIRGQGFACSGRVLVSVEGMEMVGVSQFKKQQENSIQFDFPAMTELDNERLYIVKKASFRFVQGAAQSNLASYESHINAVDINNINKPQISPAPSSGNTSDTSRSTESINKNTPRNFYRFRR